MHSCKCLLERWMERNVMWWGAPRRENTEGEYSGLEHEVVEDVVESIKARPCSLRGTSCERAEVDVLRHVL